jgi:ATP-binding protein involved in chromosome partitioning
MPQVPQRVIVVASGKGGVGKSTLTVNLAILAAQRGLKVGILDADLHGFSIPRLLGITAGPTKIETEAGSRLEPPSAHGIKVMSVGMFTDSANAVVWRGPVAHRALTQFLSETIWGPLDILFVDLPPGTGDVAISIANLLPAAELLVVTTPAAAAAEVAARAGAMSKHTQQKVSGVVENQAWLLGPNGQHLELLGTGGGAKISAQLTESLGYPVPLLEQIPLDPQVSASGDQGTPVVLSDPDSPAAVALRRLSAQLLTPPSR